MSADNKTRILTDVGTATAGTQLSGIYELDSRIGSGGMGEVYRGHNIQTGDHVAIKIVLPEYAHNQTILSLVRKEASILNRLSHDAIVRYHVFTIDPVIGRPYLAMEFVDGESLLDVMRHGPMSTADVRKLCHRLASGLSAVHEAGAVHRDLSPDNIILPGGRVERAKIIDFGIARSATIGGGTLIGGGFAGKYNYVSPEQLGLFGGDVREASDIYSLGLVLAAAMRGTPIEMDGSQLEVVEKRRTVPDLSGIDPEFRPMIEAMLQPDPADRPASMAEIVAMTRDDTNVTAPPRSLPLRHPDPASAKTELSSPPWPATVPTSANFQGAAATAPTTSWSGAREPDFVPYIPPAHLSQPRPTTAPAAEAAPPARSSNARNIVLAAAASVVVVVAAGAYLGGFLTPPKRIAAADAVETLPTDTVGEASLPAAAPAAERVADGSAGDQPPKDIAPSAPTVGAVAVPPAGQPADTAEQGQAAAPAVEQAAAPAATEQAAPVTVPEVKPAPSEAPLAAPVIAEQLQAIANASDQAPEASASGETAVAPAPAILPESQPDDTEAQAQAPVPAVEQVAAPVAAQPVVELPAPVTTQPAPVVEQPAPVVEQSVPVVEQPAMVSQPVAEPAKPDPQATAPAPSAQPTAPQASASEAAQPAPAPKPEETAVAMNVPAPPVAASDAIDTVADRVSWLHDYRGGDCFYATVTSATDKAIEIEGFGTTVAPFEQMLEAFQGKFHVEPDVSVRLIEPAQCEITNFLRVLGATTAKRPKLALDRTSVPNGSAISGTLEARGGLRASLLLIDNKGMAFSLDRHVVVQGGKAIFNVPISLGAVDQAAGKAVPQIVVAVTGDVDLTSAEFSNSTAASIALPKILAEIQAKGLEFSATAKYFRLGG